jgi:hypothetical protein
MDAWWPRLVTGAFRPTLGRDAFDRVRGMLALGDSVGGNPSAPDQATGWFGYVHKDLRSIYGPRRPRGAYSRRYCARGSRVKCRRALQAALREALRVTPRDLYGRGACSNDPDAECFDRNRNTVTGAIGLPAMPHQNRPTFQQTVSLSRRLPR